MRRARVYLAAAMASMILAPVIVPFPVDAHPVSGHRDWSAGDYDILGIGAVSQGDQVGMWQSFVAYWEGIPCEGVDGYFGSQTETGTAALQFIMSLSVDGIVGPETWGAASNTLEFIGPEDPWITTRWAPEAGTASGPWPYYTYIYAADWFWSTLAATWENDNPSDHPAITFVATPGSCP